MHNDFCLEFLGATNIRYSKTSQSADFGTKKNTADFEIRRLQVTTRLDMLFSPTLPEQGPWGSGLEG